MERSRITRVSSLLFAFTSLLSFVAADAVDFHYYPAASQDCLYQASNSSHCDASSVAKYNGCVCTNGGGFLDTAASCLGSNDSGDLNTVYNTLSTNCGNSNTPLSYTLEKWLSAAGQGSSSSSGKPTSTAQPSTTKVSTIVVTASTSATTPVVSTITLASSSGDSSAVVSVVTVTPGQATVVTLSSAPTGASGPSSQQNNGSSNNGGSSKKISTGAIAGIAVGGGAVAAIAGGLIVWLCLRRRKNEPSATGGMAAEANGPPNYGGPVPYSATGDVAETKPGHQSFASFQQPTPEPMKYTYGNQQVGGQPMYAQPNPGYSPQPQYGQPAAYVTPPQHGYNELQGGEVARPMELPAGPHY